MYKIKLVRVDYNTQIEKKVYESKAKFLRYGLDYYNRKHNNKYNPAHTLAYCKFYKLDTNTEKWVEISLEDVGKKVRIAGWVQTIRDFGGLVFLDIRDMYGITQVVTSGKPEDVDFASHIPIESAVTVFGTECFWENCIL